MKTVYDKLKDRGLEIIALEATRDTEGAEKFIKENNLPFKMIENGEGDEDVAGTLFGVHTFPTSYVIAPDGKIMRVHIGFDDGDETKFIQEISPLLEQ